MTHYPTEDGFKDEREEPNQYDDFDNPCNQSHSNNGICPCCGGYTWTSGGNYDDDPMQEHCDTCDWNGAIEYE